MITPEKDASDIWEEAAAKGIAKYHAGVAEHGGGFWSAGAGWYADELEKETLDLVAYFHHLRQRIKAINALADAMLSEEIGLRDAAILLKDLANSHPPRSRRKNSAD